MKSLTDSFLARPLGWLAHAVYHYPRLFFYPQVALFVVCVFYTVDKLKFDPSRNNLVGEGKKYHQNFLSFKKEFPAQDDLVVVVEGDDMEKNRQFVERLGAKLEAETNLFTDVFFKGDLKILGRKALLFVPEKDLAELKQTLRDYRPFIEQFTRATNFITLFDLINTQFRTAKREKNAETDSLLKALPVLERIVMQGTSSLRRPGVPPSPGIYALFSAGEEAEQQLYITFAKGKIYLATTRALREDLNVKAVERLGELVEQTKVEVPGLNVGITGEPVLEHDEMMQSQADTSLASVVSLIVCALIFIYGYQETGRPIKATICLIVGLAYTLAFATFSVGHLNILTITFVPILIGLAIDYAVHLITRYEEELRHGRSEEAALHKALVFTGQGILTGAFTTGGAFGAMALTNFKGIQEMGIICGGGLLICLVPMMTLLPVLLLRGRQNLMDHKLSNKIDRRAQLEELWLRRPRLVLVVTLALCGLSLFQFRKIYFDYDLLNMQSPGLPAVVFEKKLIVASSLVAAEQEGQKQDEKTKAKSILFCAVMADSPQQAVELEERIKKLSSVAGVDSMSQYFTEDQTRKLSLIGEIKQEIASIHFAEPDCAPVTITDLSQTLWSLQGYLGAAAEEVKQEDAALHKQLIDLRKAIGQWRKEMLSVDANVAANKLAAIQQALFKDVRETFHAIQNQDDRERMRPEDLPLSLRNRFVGVTGKYLLQVYPKKDVWQRENQREFINELRNSLDANDTNNPIITGTPIQLYEYTTLLKKSYETAAWYSLGAIAILVFIHFRSLACVVLALLPVAVGSIWMLGLMAFFQVPFNPANIMTLPLVIGIGVTNGIQILNRFAEERNPGIFAKSTGKAVLVSGLTAIAGFGSLILAKHQGIQSLGYVMSTGIATCMIAGLTFLPAVLKVFMIGETSTKEPSGDNTRSTLGQK